MKLFSKILSLLLCACMLLSMAACATGKDSDTPEGMKIATAAGADFRFYVPTVWNLNTAYGISGAYYTMSRQSTVSAVKYEITPDMRAELDLLTAETDATEAETVTGTGESGQAVTGISGKRIEWFWQNELLPAAEETALGGSVVLVKEDSKSGTLDGANARQYHLTASINGAKTHLAYTVAERGNAFYVLSFVADDELYSALVADFNSMADAFRFADEPYYPDEYVKELDTGAEAPEGMRLASNDDVAYRFYVPTDWTVNRDEEIFSAHFEADRSSVSVVPYYPNVDSMSVATFFSMCEQMMLGTAGADGYSLLKTENEVDLGGRVATAYTYTYTVGGNQYQYLQVVAAYKSMIYSLTYTATPDRFESHLEDVWAMVEAFEFR